MKKKILSFIFALLTLGLGLSTQLHATVVVDSIYFGDTITIGNVHGNGATYVWSTGAIMVPQITVSPLITTTYVQHWDDTLYHQIPVHDTFLVVVRPRPNTLTIDSIFVGQSRTIGTLRSYANGYDWNTCATSAQITVSPLFTTTYFVRWQNAVTADIATDTFKIVVKNSPATSTTLDSLCKGTNTTIGYPYTNGVWYLWNTGATTPSISVFVQYTTTYVVSVLNSSMTVIQQDTFKIVVKNNPNVWVTGPTLPICTGSNVTLIAHGAVNYHWFVGPNSDTLNIFGLTTSAQFIVVGTGSNGCSDTMTYPVTVQAPPTIYALTGDNTYCANQQGVTIGLNGSESNCHYNLYKNGVSVAYAHGTGSDISFGIFPAGNYIAKGFKDNVYCESLMNGTLNVTVKPLPGYIGYIIGDTIVCQGNTRSYLVSYSSYATTYLWSVPNGATIVSGQGTGNATIHWGDSIGGIVSVIGVNACGIGQARTFSVFVKPKPSVTITNSPSTICHGGSATLTAITNANSVLWNNGITTMSQVTSPFNVGPVPVQIAYSVTATDTNGCSNSAFTVVTVNPKPNVTVQNTSTVCPGHSVFLTASGANSYLWSNYLGTGTTTSVAPMTPSTYWVVGTDINGCSDTAFISINTFPIPSITLTATSDTICLGQSTTLSANGANSYVWSHNSMLGVGNSISITPIIPGNLTYKVTATDTNGCTNIDSIIVHIYPNPQVIVSVSQNTVCSGNPVTLSANGANSYVWNGGMSGNSIQVSPNITTTYTVIGTNLYGCSDTVSHQITVSSPLQVIFTSGGNVSCPGGNDGFANASVTGGTPPYTYFWYPTPTNGQGTNAANGLHSAIYLVHVADAVGCNGTNTVAIQEPQPISITPVVNGNTVGVSVTGGTILMGGGYQYHWVPAPQSGQGTGNATFAPGTSSVILTVLDGHYCQASQVIYINSTGIDELDEKSISIYPNPAKDVLYINSAEKFQYIEIYSIVGKSVLKIKGSNEVNIASLAPGTYIISFIDASGITKRKKFIKE